MIRAAAWLTAAVLCTGCGRAPAEAPPQAPVVANPTETDIWVAELLDSGRRLRVGTPANVTDRPGYDNQPFFLSDGSGFLYTSIDSDGQADTWRHEFDRGRSFRVTRTSEGEYSPTPSADGGFTVVRVEPDGRQRLWAFDDDGGNPRLVLESVEPVGYQAWLSSGLVALFILGEPPVLAVADLATGATSLLLSSIGRSLHPVPASDKISVVHKASAEEWNIVAVDPGDGEVEVLAPLLRPAEDFAWLPDGQLIMGRGAKVFVREPGAGHEWREIADFSEHGVSQITRIAASPTSDRIAFVAQR